MQNKVVFVLLILLIVIVLLVVSKEPHRLFFAGAEPDLKNITYCSIDNHPEQMDIYFPKDASKSNKKYPVVMYIHGGGWVAGDKQFIWGNMQQLPQFDFIFVSMNYTLSPPVTFPLNIEETACAVRYLRSKANDYHIDVNHIALFGDSAGGQLVTLEAVSAKTRTYDVGPYLDYSSEVQAVVDVNGPVNLMDAAARAALNAVRPHLLESVFGSEENLKSASPVLHVDAAEPPFLIVHGDSDNIVPFAQSVELYNVLRAHGNKAQLILVKNANHSFDSVNNQPISPRPEEFIHSVVVFLQTALH